MSRGAFKEEGRRAGWSDIIVSLVVSTAGRRPHPKISNRVFKVNNSFGRFLAGMLNRGCQIFVWRGNAAEGVLRFQSREA